jgi:hypothetical protein
MLKFYIVKSDEREGDGYRRIMEFENHHDLEVYLRYHRAYITEMQTLDMNNTYSFTDVQGVTVSDVA